MGESDEAIGDDSPRALLEAALRDAAGSKVVYCDGDEADSEEATIRIWLANDVAADIGYWRLFNNGRAIRTSFDHGASRGAVRLDAVSQVSNAIIGRMCLRIELDARSNDLIFRFEGEVALVAFSLRSIFEDWELSLPNGDTYWSNQLGS